jgi:hypothetical protein
MIDFRRLIYHLKQSYGTEVDLYKENNEVLDALTGRVTVINTKYTIKKAIVLPSDTSASSPFLRQANLLFKLSGTLDIDLRQVILDSRDLIFNNIVVIPERNDYINYQEKRYDISQVYVLDRGTKIYGYHLYMKEAVKSPIFEITEYQFTDTLSFAQKVTRS